MPMPGTRSDLEDIDLTIIDQKDSRPFVDRVVPEIVHPPPHDVDRDQIGKPEEDDSSDSDETVTDTDVQFDWTMPSLSTSLLPSRLVAAISSIAPSSSCLSSSEFFS